MSRTGQRDGWSDAELLAAIAQRNGEASTAFYRRHLPRTLAYLMRETRDPEITADLAAEVFVSVIASAHRYRPQTETAAPWVIAIARNALGVSRRRGRVQDRVRRRLAFEPIALDDTDLQDTETIAATGQERVIELVNTLHADERDAITARVVDERPYSEISEQLRCSELVARKRVSRGLRRIRTQLENLEQENG